MNKKLLQDSPVTINLQDLRMRAINPRIAMSCISITTFKPNKQYQKYYMIEEGVVTDIIETNFNYTLQDSINVHFGNCFKTKKDALKVLKSIKKMYL